MTVQYNIDIEFPRISKPMPDVWGIGEELQIGFHRKKTSNPFDENYVLYIGGIEKMGLSIKEELSYAYHIFEEKGLYEIRAMDKKGRDIEGERRIKIVEYREEIIELAKNLFRITDNNGNSLAEDLTPRELGLKIKQNITPEIKGPVDELVRIFEIAAYSLRKIIRADYEMFYINYISCKNYFNRYELDFCNKDRCNIKTFPGSVK